MPTLQTNSPLVIDLNQNEPKNGRPYQYKRGKIIRIVTLTKFEQQFIFTFDYKLNPSKEELLNALNECNLIIKQVLNSHLASKLHATELDSPTPINQQMIDNLLLVGETDILE
jgi:hypothetical protein